MSRTGKFIPGSRKKGASKSGGDGGGDGTGPLRAPDGGGEGKKKLLPKGSRFSRPVDRKRKPGVLILSAAALILMVVMGYHYLVTVPAQQQAAAAQAQLAAERKKYEEIQKELEKERQAREAAAAQRATVVVNTNPPGATVLLAGQSQKSPARFEDIKPGTYTLTIDLPGYVTHTQPLELAGDQELDLGTIKLSKRVGTLQLEAPGVDGANYKLRGPGDKEWRGKLPATVEGLPEGVYELEAEHRGWSQPLETVEVLGDIVNTHEVKFGYASVTIESEPEGATVREANRVVGTTPLTIEGLRPGLYAYTVDKAKHRVEELSIEVAEGEQLKKKVSLDRAKSLTTSNGIEMIWVPAAGVYASKHEITQQQYQSVMGINPSNFSGGDRPVENVSYKEAEKFVKTLTGRERAKGTIRGGAYFALPSGAQWSELVGDADLDLAATSHNESLQSTKPVGASEPNQYGLYDVLGNVGEWTTDEFGGRKNTRTIRGGNWLSSKSNFPNANSMSGAGLGYRDRYTGIRVVLVGN